MVGRGASGTLVNINTMSAYGGQPHLAPYVAAKAPLVGLTQQRRRRRLPPDVGARPNPRI
jgi:NAD(P)-dependent dehydrogenase (short-subunit alcohol dehydrogenase family)